MSSKSINLEPLAYRMTAIVAGGALITILLLSASWLFANAIAGGTDSTEIAQFAAELGPGDPQTHHAAALLLEKSFREEDLKSALKESEMAVSLSPSDYMLWQTLARLRERSGDVGGAEKAIRKALELAPNNAAVQWAAGNVLLRQEKFPESFELIRKAVDGDPRFARPAASIAWDIFEGDVSQVRRAIGNSNAAVSSMALYLAQLKRFDEAFEMWKTLPKQDRDKMFLDETNAFISQVIEGKRFSLALAASADLISVKELVPKMNTVTNGGFEYDIARDSPGAFEWSIQTGTRPSVGVSVEEKQAGSKSIALLFDELISKEFRTVSQTIAVTPGGTFTFFAGYKSRLEGKATLIWTVSDAASGELLAATEPIAAKSGGWQTVETEFSVPAGSDGVIIRLAKATCPDASCPLRGAVWFDQIGLR